MNIFQVERLNVNCNSQEEPEEEPDLDPDDEDEDEDEPSTSDNNPAEQDPQAQQGLPPSASSRLAQPSKISRLGAKVALPCCITPAVSPWLAGSVRLTLAHVWVVHASMGVDRG